MVATQRRRISAINTVHTRHGYPPPGRSETVRRRLDTARAARLDQLAALLHRRAAQLPTTGWPGGLFGRRDGLLLVLAATGMLLVLAATGMPFAQLARLRRGDVTVDAAATAAAGNGSVWHRILAPTRAWGWRCSAGGRRSWRSWTRTRTPTCSPNT